MLITVDESEDKDITSLAQQEIITESTISESDFNEEENHNNKEEDKLTNDAEEQDNKDENAALIRSPVKKCRVFTLSVWQKIADTETVKTRKRTSAESDISSVKTAKKKHTDTLASNKMLMTLSKSKEKERKIEKNSYLNECAQS